MPFILSQATSIVGGNSVATLSLLEQRVQTQLLLQLTNTADNNANPLRNDEAPVLGIPVPVPSA